MKAALAGLVLLSMLPPPRGEALELPSVQPDHATLHGRIMEDQAMTYVDAMVEIVKILAKLWYDTDRPFNNQQEIYRVVTKVSRELFSLTDDTYDRAILERDATKILCEHYGVH